MWSATGQRDNRFTNEWQEDCRRVELNEFREGNRHRVRASSKCPCNRDACLVGLFSCGCDAKRKRDFESTRAGHLPIPPESERAPHRRRFWLPISDQTVSLFNRIHS